MLLQGRHLHAHPANAACRARRPRRHVASAAAEPQPPEQQQQQQQPDAAAAAAAAATAPQQRQRGRNTISERIELLKRQNESLKQAIGVFLDQPQDVGVLTGKPTGSWDGDGTAALLSTLRKRSVDGEGAEGEKERRAAADGAEDGADEQPSSSSSSEAVADAGEAQQGPVGPVFSTSLSPTWSDAATSSSPAAIAPPLPPPAAPAAPDPSGAAPAAAAAAAAAAGAAAPSSSSSSLPAAAAAAAPAAAAAAAAPAAPPAAAPPAKPAPVPLGTIHERVEQMEREHQEQERQQAAKLPPAVKPRATARRPPPSSAAALDIVFVSAEVAPWSKTGGLGDVMGALPQAMAARGHRVMVVTPRYTNGGKDVVKYKDAKPADKSVWVELRGAWHELKYHTLHKEGVDHVFVEHLAFQREGTPYGNAAGPFEDNLFRFALLCLGALEAPLNLPLKRDSSGALLNEPYGQDVMFVANDWHAAVLPLLLAARLRPHGVYERARVCLAIHNLSHQGSYEAHRFHDLGLPGEWYGALEWEDPCDSHRRKTINVLKAGIVTSDLLVTVSQGYAAEITGRPQDARVDMLLAQRAPRLRGIVNGVDVAEWDPATDKHLAARYSADDLTGKAACKRALQREMRLPMEPDVPLIGFIGRLDYQKGPDLVLDALPLLANLDCQVVLLGSGAADYEERLRAASHDWGWFARGHVGFSVPLSHKIIAGCDMLLMPSRFEPCGLNQLYGMRYGTVPIAHATGGLVDTIADYNPFSKGEGEGTGWTFAPAEVEPMVAALSTAVELYREQPERWRALQLRGMAADFSWERAAQQYEVVLSEAMADGVQYTRK